MMAFDARGFDKSAGQHRKIPKMIGLPVMFLHPVGFLGSVVGRMRCQIEFRGTSLSRMANGAAEFLFRMRTVAVDEQIQVWMCAELTDAGIGQIRLGQFLYQLDIADVEIEVFENIATF